MGGKVDPTRGSGKEPEGPEKKRKNPDSDAFREMMKVSKVRETDPEEKKKKKSQAEVEEDFKAAQTGAPQQGLEEEGPPSIFEPTQGTEPTSSGQGVSSNLPPSPEVQATGDENLSTESTTRTPRKKTETIQAPTPTEKGDKKESIDKKDKPAELTTSGAEASGSGTYYEKTEEPTKEKKIEKAEEDAAAQMGVAPPPLAEGSWEKTSHLEEEEKEKIKAIEKSEQTMTTPQLDQGPQEVTAPPSTEAPPPVQTGFTKLPTEVQQLYEKMAGVMVVMHTSGISETTINLDNPQFKNSVFYGTQVVITEYSTAPKEFNIELLGTQKAVDLMTPNTDQLVATFNGSGYNFKVHRIDTGYLREAAEKKKRAARSVQKKKGAGG